MPKTPDVTAYAEQFDRLREVREAAMKHHFEAARLHKLRKEMINDLIGAGFSQADVARELGVTRQAVQKMLSL
jgi:DNA-binding XRE family transcriptional regulator